MAIQALGAIAGAFGRGAAAGGMRMGAQAAMGAGREAVRGGIRSAVKGAVRGRRRRGERGGMTSPLSGMITATKGAGGGGRSGVPMSSSIVPLPKSEASVVKAPSRGLTIADELAGIRSTLEEILRIETEEKSELEDAILDYVREDEKKRRTEEQDRQEQGKTKRKKRDNPIVSGAKKAVKGIFGMIMDLVGYFIKYKILEWIGDPKNRKSVERIVKFFSGLVKVLGAIFKHIVMPLAGLIGSALLGTIEIFGALITTVVDFFTFKWFTNPKEFVENLLNIPKKILESAQNMLGSLLNFITFGLFNQADKQADKEIDNVDFDKVAPESKGDEGNKGKQEAPKKEEKNPIQSVGDAIGGALGMLNPLNWFGGGDKKKDDANRPDLPQLAEGGVVQESKSEGGKAEVKPLGEMVGIAAIAKQVSDAISPFLDMLIAPFKIVGTALVGITLSTISKIPGVGELLKPIITMMATAFGVPREVLTILDTKTKKATDRGGEGEEDYFRPIPGQKEQITNPSAGDGGDGGGGGLDVGKLITNPVGAAADFLGGLVPGPLGDAIKGAGNFAGAMMNPIGFAINNFSTIKGAVSSAISGISNFFGGGGGSKQTPGGGGTPSPGGGATPSAPGATPTTTGGGGMATFGETGNVNNAAGWVHGHFQTNTGTAEDVVNDVAPMVKQLADNGTPVELSNGTKIPAGSSMDQVKDLIRNGIRQHGHSGDGRSVDIFVPKGTKVPFPLSDVKAYGGREGVSGILPGSGKVWVGHLTNDSKSGGAMPHSPQELTKQQIPEQKPKITDSLQKTGMSKSGNSLLQSQSESTMLDSQSISSSETMAVVGGSNQSNTHESSSRSVGGIIGNNFPLAGGWATYKTKL